MTGRGVLSRFLLPASLFLLVLAVNLARLCPGPFADDSPETVISCAVLGIAHPPGDPLLILLGRLAIAAIPAGGVAWRVNALSAAAAALAAVFAWRLGARRAAALLPRAAAFLAAFVLFTTNPVLAQQAAVAKGAAYTLNILLILAAAAALLDRRPILAAMCGGILFAHHWMTLAALVPALAVTAAVFAGPRPSLQAVLRPALLALCFASLGGSLWIALPVRASHSPALNWSRVSTVRNFAAHATRRSFHGTEMKPRPESVARQAAAGISAVAGQTGLAVAALAAAGLWAVWSCWPKLALASLAAALSPWLSACLYLDLPPDLMRLLEVFLLPSAAIVAVLAVRGAVRLSAVSKGVRGKAAIAAAGALIALSWMANVRALASRDVREYTWSHDLARGLLAPLPPGAGLLVASDLDTLPLWHAQIVENYRPDVLVVNRTLLKYPWYREAIGLPDAEDGSSPVGRLLRDRRRTWFTSADAFPEAVRLRPLPYHLTFHLAPHSVPAAAPRAFTFRGVFERAARASEPHAALTVGYIREALRNLTLTRGG